MRTINDCFEHFKLKELLKFKKHKSTIIGPIDLKRHRVKKKSEKYVR